jgi:hypothetical protein
LWQARGFFWRLTFLFENAIGNRHIARSFYRPVSHSSP